MPNSPRLVDSIPHLASPRGSPGGSEARRVALCGNVLITQISPRHYMLYITNNIDVAAVGDVAPFGDSALL